MSKKNFLDHFLTSPLTFKKVLILLLTALAVWGGHSLYYRYFSTPSPVILMINFYPMRQIDKDYYRKANPYGFLLGLPSHTNLDPRKLRRELEEVLGRKDFLFFIDQEGGEVNRIQWYDPNFDPPAPASFGRLAEKDLASAQEQVYQYGLRTGKKLKEYTVDVVFAPLAEIASSDKTPQRSRYFSSDPQIAKILSDAYARGLADGGVIPCYKHAPGFNGAETDPHYEQQIISASLQALHRDALPLFQNGTQWPFLMTAHGYYRAIDPDRISTYSPAFYDFLRRELSYDGVLIPDALNMEAATLGEENRNTSLRMRHALEAGADLVLPFFPLNTDPREMTRQILELPSEYGKRLKKKIKRLEKEGRFNVGPDNRPPWVQRREERHIIQK